MPTSEDASALLRSLSDESCTWASLKESGNALCRVRHMHGALWLHSLAAVALAQESLHNAQSLHTDAHEDDDDDGNNNNVQLTDLTAQTQLRRLRAQQFDFATFDYAAAFNKLAEKSTHNKPITQSKRAAKKATGAPKQSSSSACADRAPNKETDADASKETSAGASVQPSNPSSNSLEWLHRVPLIPIDKPNTLRPSERLELSKILYNRCIFFSFLV